MDFSLTEEQDLLLAAPAGPRATLGLDPGLRTGCKIAVVDATLPDHCPEVNARYRCNARHRPGTDQRPQAVDPR